MTNPIQLLKQYFKSNSEINAISKIEFLDKEFSFYILYLKHKFS